MITVTLACRERRKMRLRKEPNRISISERTEKVEYFRTLKVTNSEAEKLGALPKDERGFIESSEESEALLLEMLTSREMGHLLYPEVEKDKWSGYVRWEGETLFLV